MAGPPRKPRKRGRVRQVGDHLTHRKLWDAARFMHEEAEKDDGTSMHTMASMLLIYFAFESYMNYLGPRVCPNEWIDEKTYFARAAKRYRGTLGKLRLIADRCGFKIERSRRPFTTLKELDRRRDIAVHARPDHYDREVEYTRPENIRKPTPAITALYDLKFLTRALLPAQN